MLSFSTFPYIPQISLSSVSVCSKRVEEGIDKPTMRRNFSNVGVRNSNILWYILSFCTYPYLPQISLYSLSKGVSDFAFLVGTRIEEETNQLCELL